MKYMLDTNICIYLMKNKPVSVLERLRQCEPEDICISSVTYGELMHGVEKSIFVEKNRLALAILLSVINVVHYDMAAAEEYGKIRAKLEKSGTPIGPLDTMIAGHARSLDCILVTNNTREFERVDNLKFDNWAN